MEEGNENGTTSEVKVEIRGISYNLPEHSHVPLFYYELFYFFCIQINATRTCTLSLLL